MSDHTNLPDDHANTGDFLDEIVADDPGNRRLAATLRSWRDDNRRNIVEPDGHLEALFSREPAEKAPSRWRQWMQRPAIAFAASFAAIMILEIGAFTLITHNSEPDTVAAVTSSSLAATDAAAADTAQITLPSDLTEQTGYASCVADLLAGWFSSGFSADAAPRIVDDCGMPPIPDLGPEAEAYRQELQAWANCIASEAQQLLPDLATLFSEQGGDLDFATECGNPPDPRDFGLELPFIDMDWENLDPSNFAFGPFNFGEFDLDGFDFESFDLDKFLEGLPEGFVPEDFNLEEWKQRFGDFDIEGFQFNLEGCDLPEGELPDIQSLEELHKFDFGSYLRSLEGCDFSVLFPWTLEDLNLEGLNLEDFNLGEFDLEQFIQDLDLNFGDFNLDQLEGLDLEQLFADLFGNEQLDFSSMFGGSDA